MVHGYDNPLQWTTIELDFNIFMKLDFWPDAGYELYAYHLCWLAMSLFISDFQNLIYAFPFVILNRFEDLESPTLHTYHGLLEVLFLQSLLPELELTHSGGPWIMVTLMTL